ncbi:hypothetical protein D9758_018951 [Tetrapyrgos nigripes]|uniref:NADP-dependent oxidoreductase domain-containing protein n=1 Tax=Tetrapyrgos nigripes TaxID=182062 RepID=A0A8H5AQT9_9AGAR|nr:hypothetical protein D9758_018951 [Tetrapyrgos nigripes]
MAILPMSFLNPPPAPKTKLGRYRQLAPRAAIHVSPISLGGMSIGNSEKWNSSGFGAMNRDSSFKLMDAYYDAGGNFIDTANIKLIGEWMEQRKIRDQMIIATKYSNFTHNGDDSIAQRVNYIGNNVKSMKLSVEASLQRLRTGYIDILYVHWYDQHTSVEEMMDALHNLVVAGKGISDTPAWVVVKANDYAKSVGKTPFVVYQGEYSDWVFTYGVSSLEARSVRMRKRKAAWNPGKRDELPRDPEWLRKPDEVKVCDGLEAMAKEVGAKSIGALAIAYVLHKTQYMFPILGGRKVEQLMANLEALDISLSAEQIEQLDGLKEFNLGWPYNLLGKPGTYPFLITIHATIDPIPAPSPIRPVKEQ